MTEYVLWNKKEKKIFKHPHYGIWSTTSKQEADEALLDLKDGLDDVGMGHIKEHISIADYEEVKNLAKR